MKDNATVAARLDDVAILLEEQGANPFRVRAYRAAADTLRELPRPIDELLAAAGPQGLSALPGIGPSLAGTITALAAGDEPWKVSRLEQARRSGAFVRRVPGIGQRTAERLRDELGITTLEDLEAALYAGVLGRFPGMGQKRLAGIRESLAGRLHAQTRHRAAPAPRSTPASGEPATLELLSIDAEYRERAKAGELPRIAPRRFNPTGEAWLPVLRTCRNGRWYTALYSNTANAHEQGMLRDWVVIYRDGDAGARWTVITGRFGAHRGQRLVRGREKERAPAGLQPAAS